MPSRNSIKQYRENSYYHLYNRGVDKKPIFLDKQDYNVLLSYLKEYLLPKDEKGIFKLLSSETISAQEKDKLNKKLLLNNFSEEIILLVFSLMPNHFHFLVKQESASSIDKFMNSLCTRYTRYFNKKYKRVGPLYQGVYKAVLINTEEQFLHLSYYIHKQALNLQGDALEVQPCSYYNYTGKRKNEWINTEIILEYFSKTNSNFSYEAFIKKQSDYKLISKLLLED